MKDATQEPTVSRAGLDKVRSYLALPSGQQTRAEALHRVRGPSGRREGAQAAGGPARAEPQRARPRECRPPVGSRPEPGSEFRDEAGERGVGRAGSPGQSGASLEGATEGRGGAQEPGKARGGARRRGPGGARQPRCGLGAEAAPGSAGGRAGPYRAAGAGRRRAPTPAWPPEPRVPTPRRPSPAVPPGAASPALQVARLRTSVTDRKFPPTGAK